MKKILYTLLGMTLMIGGTVFAAPYYNYSRTILPQTDNGEDLGTSTQAWRNLYTNNEYLYGLSDGCLFTSSHQVSSTGSPCGSGGGNSFAFPFTPTSYGVSTSTTVGLLNGFLSTASSTINSNLWLPALSQGSAYIGSNGLVQSTATTSVSCSGSASCTPFTVFGSSPITISASGSGGGSGNVSTSTNETAGTIAYWTSNSATPALLGKVSTTSLGVSAPITFSGTLGAQVGGVAGSFGCTTASAGVTGCLSGTDWTTFNNKGSGTVTSVTGTYPIISTGGNTPVISSGFGTTTTIGIGNDLILYTSHTGVMLGVASSSLSLPNTALQNSTISGVALGGTLANHSHDTSLTGTTYNGSAAVSDWGLALNHSNIWTALQSFGANASTTGLSAGYGYFGTTATSSFSNAGVLTLGTTTAGCLNISATGNVYSATCASGGGGISDPFTHPSLGYSATTSVMMIGTSTPAYSQLTIGSSTTPQLTITDDANTAAWSFRDAGSNLYIGTTSPTTYATSSIAALSLTGTGYPKIAIGTTSPFAVLSAVNISGLATVVFAVSTSTGTSGKPNFEVDSVGHEIYSGPSPKCDASCTMTAGNDNRFRITTGTSVTQTTVTFANAWPIAPVCFADEGSAGTVNADASSTPTTVVISLASALTTKDVEVWCDGIQ